MFIYVYLPVILGMVIPQFLDIFGGFCYTKILKIPEDSHHGMTSSWGRPRSLSPPELTA